MIIADTDVLIDFLAGQSPVAERIGHEIQYGLKTTAISYFELLSGAHTTKQDKAIRTLLAALEILPLDNQTADKAAEVRRILQKKGLEIGMGDSLIAGIALYHQGILLTRNRKHFERVEGLTLGQLK